MNFPSHLELSEIHYQYPSRELSLRPDPLLNQISFRLDVGEVMHIRGPNGSGKTSLLKLCAGIYRPDAGFIRYGERDIWSDLTTYQQNICYMGHKNGFNPGLTVWEHAQWDGANAVNTQDISQILHDLELWAIKDKLGYLLSAGQKRRVALLRLCLSPAQLWLLDEPLVALDQAGIAYLVAQLQRHTAQGGQIIYTSHQALPWQTANQQEYVLA